MDPEEVQRRIFQMKIMIGDLEKSIKDTLRLCDHKRAICYDGKLFYYCLVCGDQNPDKEKLERGY